LAVTTNISGAVALNGTFVGNFHDNPELLNMSEAELLEFAGVTAGGGTPSVGILPEDDFGQFDPQDPFKDVFPDADSGVTPEAYNLFHGTNLTSGFRADWTAHHVASTFVPTPEPVFSDPIIPNIDPSIPIAQGSIGGLGMAIVLIPRLITVMRSAAAITVASRAGSAAKGLNWAMAGGVTGSVFSRGLAALGVVSAVDFFLQMFNGSQDSELFAEMVQELVDSGWINTPGERRDGTETPQTWLHWHIADSDAKPFLNSEYINRKFVASVRKNERTPRYRGRPNVRGTRGRRS